MTNYARASTLKGKPLTVANVRKGAKAAAKFVQGEKIRIARSRIHQFQQRGRWPEEYVSYAGSVGRDPFNSPETFFRVMAARPERYGQRFTFLPADSGALSHLFDAATMAYDLATRQGWKYGIDTGLYGRSFKLYVREGGGRREILSLSQLQDVSAGAVFELTNAVSYASTVESNALNLAKIGGVIYYAAKQVQKLYPQLGVSYTYKKAAAYGFSHVYDVPVLTIGSRQIVRDRFKRPGRRLRERRRIRGKLRKVLEG